ncbi:MAG: ribosomal-processing cysteine protease Prp [Spirochaetota bacterium]
MIDVRVVVDGSGALSSLTVRGHASLGSRTVSAECAAVSGIVRACAQAIDERGDIAATGSADAPGDLVLSIDSVAAAALAWLRGVTDVIVTGIARVARESPQEVTMAVEYEGDTHGS